MVGFGGGASAFFSTASTLALAGAGFGGGAAAFFSAVSALALGGAGFGAGAAAFFSAVSALALGEVGFGEGAAGFFSTASALALGGAGFAGVASAFFSTVSVFASACGFGCRSCVALFSRSRRRCSRSCSALAVRSLVPAGEGETLPLRFCGLFTARLEVSAGTPFHPGACASSDRDLASCFAFSAMSLSSTMNVTISASCLGRFDVGDCTLSRGRNFASAPFWCSRLIVESRLECAAQ